ncbi:MAG: 2TM domain-containing protein [Flavobacteriaceae bacterium]
MFSEKTKESKIRPEHHLQLEYAQKRIRQKKLLYTHFVVYLIGSVFLFLTNKILKYGEDYDWSIWLILFWGFLLVIHVYNVFVNQRFMGAEWERKQREILVTRQRERIAQIQKEIETEFPLSKINKKKEPWESSP